MNQYFLYQHKDLQGEVFYIGMGTLDKNSHSYKGYGRAYSKGSRNKSWKEKAEQGYIVEILETSQDKKYIKEKEDTLSRECKTCVNKQFRSSSPMFTIHKIDDEICMIRYIDCTYYITNKGEFLSSEKKPLKLHDDGRGYLIAKLFSNGKGRNIGIHRLVALSFVENPQNKECVNHIDCNKYNNRSDNLEWVTYSENNIHRYKHYGETVKRKGKHVLQYDKDGNLVKEWNSVKDASKFYGCSPSLINISCNAKNKKKVPAKGYFWYYK